MKRAPLSEHLEELLHRMYIALAALIVCSILCLPLVPYTIRFMKENLLPPDVELVALSPFDNIIALFEMTFVLGFILSFPVILYEVLKFIVPALYEHELKVLYLTMPLGILLFLLGASLGFKLILPTMYSICSKVRLGQTTIFSLRSFIEYTIMLLLGFGLSFELPLVMAVLNLLGIIPVEAFKENRPVSYIVLAIIGIVFLTPEATTILDLIATFLLIGLYELGIFVSELVEKHLYTHKA